MTLHASLSLLREQADKQDEPTLQRLLQGVEQGIPLSELLRQNRFHPMVAALVTVGETSGNLHIAFGRLADYFRHRFEWKQQLTGSLMYPMIVLFIMLSAALFILYAILPRFETMYLNLGFDLPPDTRMLFATAAQVRQYFPWIIVLLLSFGILIYSARNMMHSRFPVLTALILSLPGIKWLWRAWISFRLADITAVMLASGVPLLQALETGERIAWFSFEQRIIASLRERILAGDTLTEALQTAGWFDPMLVHAVHAAEASGELTQVLGFVAKELENDLQQVTQRMVKLVEPALILVLGTGIGLVILAVIVPMMEMVQSI